MLAERDPEIKPRYIGEWIAPIVRELDALEGHGAPLSTRIIERYDGRGRFSVMVVWDHWRGVPADDRRSMIVRAYERSSRFGDLPRLSHSAGFTRDEYEDELVRLELRAGGDMIEQTTWDMLLGNGGAPDEEARRRLFRRSRRSSARGLSSE